MEGLVELAIAAPWVLLLIVAVLRVLTGRRSPPPRLPVVLDADLERERLEAIERRRDDRLAPIRELARDPDADRRTEALAREVGR